MTDVPPGHPAYECTDTELTLHVPLDELEPGTRLIIATWLVNHGVDLDTLVIGYPVRRRRDRSALEWRYHGAQGDLVRTRIAPRPFGTWPEPFPTALLRGHGRDRRQAPTDRGTRTRSRRPAI